MRLPLVSPYLALPPRPLHVACEESCRRAGRRPPCESCVLSDRCAWERARREPAPPGPAKPPSG